MEVRTLLSTLTRNSAIWWTQRPVEPKYAGSNPASETAPSPEGVSRALTQGMDRWLEPMKKRGRLLIS
jgi:hypothetical protein